MTWIRTKAGDFLNLDHVIMIYLETDPFNHTTAAEALLPDGDTITLFIGTNTKVRAELALILNPKA